MCHQNISFLSKNIFLNAKTIPSLQAEGGRTDLAHGPQFADFWSKHKTSYTSVVKYVGSETRFLRCGSQHHCVLT